MTERIPAIFDSSLKLEDAVNRIAATDLKAHPGTELIYGASGFHVAGRVAEVVTGKDWHTLFEEKIKRPLGMKNSVFGNLDPKDRQKMIAPSTNPWLGGGLQTTMNDYGNFMRMLVNDGVFKGKRVLSAESVREMRMDQSGKAKITSTLHPDRDTHYSLGGWVERADEKRAARLIRDMGALGWNPWIDFDRGYFAVFGVRDQQARVWPLCKKIEGVIQKTLDPGAPEGKPSGSAPKSGLPKEVRPGQQDLTLKVGDRTRSYLVHVPANYDPKKPVAVVIMFHRGGGLAKDAIAQTGWDRKAEQEGFLAVFPQAVQAPPAEKKDQPFAMWNDGSGRANTNVDDVAFVNALIDDLSGRFAVDSRRVYLTGFAAGASMTFRAGHELAHRVAAIAPVSGHLWSEDVKLTEPVSLICFLGTDDPINPMKAGVIRTTSVINKPKPPVRDSVWKWARALGTTGPSELTYLGDGVFRETFSPTLRQAEAVFYVVEGMGHQWPGGKAVGPEDRLGKASDKVKATEVIWAFFQKHPKGERAAAPGGASSPAAPEEKNYSAAADYSAKSGGRAVLVMIDGKVVFERYDNGHAADKANHLHSATKSFWGPAVAAMIEDGLIESFDELACKTLTEWKDDPRKSKITVRHLLTLTAGLEQDIRNLQGLRPAAKDLYAHATGLKADTEPGEKFRYGPSCYYALGELMKRKLAKKKQTPLDYLKERILNPIGVKIADWVHDSSGNPHIPNGAHLTARDWAKFGQWVLQGGKWDGKQVVNQDLLQECFKPCKANPGHGLTWWLNQPGGLGATGVAPPKKTDGKAGWIYPANYPDLAGALGAGKCRMYVIPSLKMVVVRQCESQQDSYQDDAFLALLLGGKAASRDR